MRYRAVSKPVQPRMARELNAQYLVEGSVRRDAGRVRISVQLVRAADGRTIPRAFRGSGKGFGLQSEIALATATAIGLQVSPRTILASGTLKPVLIDAEVHDRYLRARHLMGQRTRPTIQAAMRYFQEALAIDPAFAPAMAGLAFCHAVPPITSLLRPHDCFPAAQNLAGDALSLDPTWRMPISPLALSISGIGVIGMRRAATSLRLQC